MALFVKVAVDYQTDPRILAVGPMAELMFLRGLAWSKANQLDGEVPGPALALVGMGLPEPLTLADLLVEVGIWEPHADGFRVPPDKWAKWQVTKAQVDLLAEKRRAAGKKGADARWGPKAQVSDPEKQAGWQVPCDLPPRPTDLQTYTSNTSPAAPRRDAFAAGFSECWAVYPRKEGRKDALRAYQARIRAGVDHADLLTATVNYAHAKAGVAREYVMLGKTFYGPNERWMDFLRPLEEPTVVER